MITVCWAAKGGSGTTVVAASLALAADRPTLLVDLAGDLPMTLGIPEPDSPGVHDWLRSEASTDRLTALESRLSDQLSLLPAGHGGGAGRWSELAEHLRREVRHVVVDAGTNPPPPTAHIASIADHDWLVTRPCYLALTAAVRRGHRPSGVVVIEEPGRALRAADIEAAIGAPIAATLLLDPAIARAVDSGLLVTRIPRGAQRRLRQAA
ncbi:MAG: hypothetical protein QNJ12_19480 [Ilumatobacter sp.]|uniref:hypothetical protein n=1 Tax=Ilumatobacter sp. TaxID=1967498 RepID=UPI0026204F7B|nr:hypothetical protein [Ilumatobacter sp.]MDJ0770983.1 hypothetical protein [Ilumatobacter sp.]